MTLFPPSSQRRLHPLAVEDALRSSRNPRSKCDFYKTHLYLQILVQHIHAPDRLALARAAEGFDDTEWPSSIADDDEFPIEGPRRRKPWAFWRHSGEIRLPEGVDSVFEPSVRDTMGRSNDVGTTYAFPSSPTTDKEGRADGRKSDRY